MEEETKERLVRAVLLFCAILIAAISSYTTFMLFSTYEIDVSFSPPEDAAQFSPQERNNSPTASFNVNQSHIDNEGNLQKFETEPVRPYKEDERNEKPITINPLVISEHLEDARVRIVFVLIALEIVIVYFVYRGLDRKVRKRTTKYK